AEASQLLRAQVTDQTCVIHTGHVIDVAFDEPVADCERADKVRFLDDPVQATNRKEEGVISRDIASQAVLHAITQQPVSRSSEAVMKKAKFPKGIALPAQHVRFSFIDRFPSCPSINFGCPSDMELGVCLNFQLSVNLVTDSSPTNPKLRLLIEVFKT